MSNPDSVHAEADSPHIPERGPEIQLRTAVNIAKQLDTPEPDVAFEAVDAVVSRFDLTTLQRAYSTFQLLATHDATQYVTDHWTEDAGYQVDALVEELYERTLRNLVRQELGADVTGPALEYSRSQPSTLNDSDSPRETFKRLYEQAQQEVTTHNDLYDLMGEFQDTYKRWSHTVVVQHILYLANECGVDPADTGFIDQLNEGEPPGGEAIDYVLGSALYHATEKWLSECL